ncbi:hypothetical protein C8Q80DRAFT_35969 [Daedaleopsis nitida]|nr:hypothetical protein C8Q80DRAFT_35969 [Daedaleopsis nitida]
MCTYTRRIVDVMLVTTLNADSAGRAASGSDSQDFSSARHKALASYDILWHIFNVSSQRHLSRADLSRCAQVCRAFSAPAIRIIWSALPSIVPLWTLVAPPSIPNLRSYNDAQYAQIFAAAQWTNSDCWNRFLGYSIHVSNINYLPSISAENSWEHPSDQKAALWNAKLIRAVLDNNHGTSVFPNLQVLTWHLVSREDPCLSFLSSSLSHLTIHFIQEIDADEQLQALLLKLREVSPYLKSFIFQTITDRQIGSWLVEELVQHPHLRSIQLSTYVRADELHTLTSTIPLVEISAPIGAGPELTRSPTSSASAAASLRKLEIVGSSPDISGLFATGSYPSLRSAFISIFDDSANSSDFPSCTAEFAHALRPDTLRDLHLQFNRVFVGTTGPHEARHASLRGLLQPLLFLTSLQSFILRYDGPTKLSADDETFSEIARSWTALRSLYLDFRTWDAAGSIPTPFILVHLAHYCPSLQELVLPYLAHDITSMGPLTNDGAVHTHPLRRLFIADDNQRGVCSSLSSIVKTVDLVDHLFPHLDTSFRAYFRAPTLAWCRIFAMLRERRSAKVLIQASC